MNDKINQKQLTMVLTNLLIVKIIFSFPRLLFKTSGNAAWIQSVYLTAVAYIILELSIYFFKYTGKRSVIQLSEAIGKQPLKIAVSLLVVIILTSKVGTSMRTYAESVKIILLPNTRIEYIMILFSATVALGSFCGFSALSTINAIFLPFCLFSIEILGLVLIKNYNINNIMPLWGTGIKSIFVDGLKEIYCFSDILALNLLLPYCESIKDARKSSRLAVIISGGALTLICLIYGMIYPYPVSADFMFATYQLTRLVRAGEYFQRFEALFEFVWSITQLLYTSIYIFLICIVLKDAFKLRHSNALIPCIVSVIAVLSLEVPSVAELMGKSGKMMGYITMPAYLLPIIISSLYIFMRRKKHAQ